MSTSGASINGNNSKEVKLLIHSVTWNPKDHISELDDILQGASAESVEKELVRYVIDNIEPVGWRAVCRSIDTFSGKSNSNVYFLVDVVNVSQEKLESSVIVRDIVGCDGSQEMELLKKNFINKNSPISVPLIHLYPMVNQENDPIDIETTTEVIEQVRFFFEHIWQPWDLYEDVCNYDYVLINNRMKIYEEMEGGVIPPGVCLEMKAIRAKATDVAERMKDLEARNGGAASQADIDPQDILQMMRLGKEIRRLQERYEALRDPALREITLQQEQFERKELMKSLLPEEPANIFVVASSVTFEDLVNGISNLPEILKDLPQIGDCSRVKTCPSLQFALDFAETGDTIALLPGSHLLKNLGSLAGGGTLCGLGEGVEIVGSLSTGDVILDLTVAEARHFVMRSVDLRPLEGQTCVSLHRGRALLQQCSIKGGAVGISLLSGSECQVERSRIYDVQRIGIDCKGESELVLSETKFERCQEAALRIDENAKINLLNDVCISDCPNEGLILDHADDADRKRKIHTLKDELKSKIIFVNKEEIGLEKIDQTQ